MNRKQARTLVRILLAGAMLAALRFLPAGGWLRFVLYLVPYLTAGGDILLRAAKGVKRRQVLDENFLMAVATLGAFALAVYDRSGDYTEAVAVMLFYQVGELFQSLAVERSRRNIGALMDLRPDYANVERDGRLERVDPDEVPVGSVIVVRPGERVPIDGVVAEGRSSLDTSALTGESVPRGAGVGDAVVSGSINRTGVLRIRTTREFGESTVSKILDLVENTDKARAERFISRFARVYTPAVCLLALALAVLPPLGRAVLSLPAQWETWAYRALTFLVISCPCALVISIPLAFFAGIGGASREGILVKGASCLEALAKTARVVLDKTGTLTQGVFRVMAVHPDRLDETGLLHLAAHVERHSSHPIAQSLRDAYPNERDSCRVEAVEELAGLGVRATVNGDEVCVGNAQLMERAGAEWHPCELAGTIIHVAINGEYAGHIIISDVLKPHAAEAVAALRPIKTVMLTGDGPAVAEGVAQALGIREVYGGLLPADKVAKVEELKKELAAGRALAFAGDGINDAPVLSHADVGIAMGLKGADAAIEAADVVLMDDDPLKIARAIALSRKCLGIVRQNIVFSIGVKLACLGLGALGLAGMGLAVFADIGVMVLAVLNSIRALY